MCVKAWIIATLLALAFYGAIYVMWLAAQ